MSAFQPIGLPGQPYKAGLVQTGLDCWLFADAQINLSPWLALRRESNSDQELKRFLFEGEQLLGYTRAIADYFNVHSAGWMVQSRIEPFLHKVFSGQIKAIKLRVSPTLRAQLQNPASHIWFVSSEQAPGYLSNPVDLAYAELSTELGTLALARWRRYDLLNGTFAQASWMEQRLIMVGSVLDGGFKAGVNLMQGAGSLAMALYDALLTIPAVVVGGVNALGQIQFSLQGVEQAIQKAYSQIQAGFQKGLGVVFQSAEQVSKYAQKGWEVLKFLYQNPLARETLLEYIDSIKESMPHVSDSHDTLSKNGLSITLAVLIAIGLFFFNPAVLPVAAAAVMVGAFTGRALQLMVKLYRMLKRMATKPVEKLGEAAGRALGERAVSPSQLRTIEES
ncbi:MAG: hypothetical protein R3194_08115, partial [Limnobacter sp.]|nr:hypothetical protein [Limnobacter sp.]